MDFLNYLDARKSVRHFKQQVTISNEEIFNILNHAANAPSGNNAQPWKVIVIKNKSVMKMLQKFSYNQEQVTQASMIILILGDKSHYNTDYLIANQLKHNIIQTSQIKEKTNRIKAYFSLHPEDKETAGLRLDIGLFSMNLMHVIRAFGYDSVPMRGVQFDNIMYYLHLPQEWVPILLLPVGKADKVGYRHVRESAEQFTTIID